MYLFILILKWGYSVGSKYQIEGQLCICVQSTNIMSKIWKLLNCKLCKAFVEDAPIPFSCFSHFCVLGFDKQLCCNSNKVLSVEVNVLKLPVNHFYYIYYFYTRKLNRSGIDLKWTSSHNNRVKSQPAWPVDGADVTLRSVTLLPGYPSKQRSHGYENACLPTLTYGQS